MIAAADTDGRISDTTLSAIRRDNPVDEVAGRHVTLRRKGRRFVGPCPICSTKRDRTDQRFECDATSWVCAVCEDGGDVFRLVARLDGLDPARDFRAIVQALAGNVDAVPTPAAAKRQGRIAQGMGLPRTAVPAELAADPALAAAWRDGWDKARRDEVTAARFREYERERLFALWQAALPIEGSPVAAYHAARRIAPLPGAHLRYAPAHEMFGERPEDARKDAPPPVIHAGPARLAAILGPDGRFSGLHATWIDPDRPGRKAEIVDPLTGEVAPAKKVRGHKVGGRVMLGGAATPRALVLGEGFETVLSVAAALQAARRDLSAVAFWSSVDLGNLGGRSLATVEHPTLTIACGRGTRPKRVPGPEPDPTAVAIPIPETVTRLMLLGDADSDPFTTRAALARAAARFARPGRIVRVAWADAGADFNDMLCRAAGDPAETQALAIASAARGEAA